MEDSGCQLATGTVKAAIPTTLAAVLTPSVSPEDSDAQAVWPGLSGLSALGWPWLCVDEVPLLPPGEAQLRALNSHPHPHPHLPVLL